MDPSVQTVANSIPLPGYILDDVRSIPGVKYAVPLYTGGALVKLHDGTYQAVNIIGLDDSSLLGRPELITGNIQDIFAENAFIAVEDSEFRKLQNPTPSGRSRPTEGTRTSWAIRSTATRSATRLPTSSTTPTAA